jgi:hypothetical protein
MRTVLAFFVGLIIATPAWAQDSGQRNYGSIVCPQQISCPNGTAADPMSPSALLEAANQCVTQHFGYAGPQGIFDASAGLDGNSCFTQLPGVIPKGAGSQLAVSCCVIPKPHGDPGTCAMRCDLNSAVQ